MKIGIRVENKSEFERRSPFIPEDLADMKKHGVDVAVETCVKRAYANEEFEKAGIPVKDDLSDRDIIFGIKEVPIKSFVPGKIYVFFAHVIKGQSYNMAMLKYMMENKITLFDYERIVDDKNRRLIFFGRHAGLAGMINTLWSLGQRLEVKGVPNPFTLVRQAKTYKDLDEALKSVDALSDAIKKDGVSAGLNPLVFAFAGYGNVSKGAQEIFDRLPHVDVAPSDLPALSEKKDIDPKVLYKVVFKEEDAVKPKDSGHAFSLQEYYKEGKKVYENAFAAYAAHVSVLVHCNYWDDRYPRLLTNDMVKSLWNKGEPKLLVIGDISCDPDGAVECTVKSTDPGNPVFVYDPETGRALDGFTGRGPLIMAVDILPTEIPRESSTFFSSILKPYVPELASADYSVSFDELKIPAEWKRALILYHGELTPDYTYLTDYLK